MSDRAVVGLAVAVWLGALLAAPVPWWVVVLAGVGAVVVRRTVVVVLAGALSACALAAVAWSGLATPAPTVGRGLAVLATDPVEVRGAVRAEARLGRRHVELWARRAEAAALRPRRAGEAIAVEGRLRAPPSRLRVRHIVARLDVDATGAWRAGSPVARAANGLRRTLELGASSLPRDDRSLLLGVVIGDVRDQSPALTQAFRDAGLSHLLVVSGENLAFVLALAGPVLRRLSLRGRWVATIAVVLFFGLLTRWEPSVLRAAAMAALACTATTMGRPGSRLRLLALAVAIVVLLDPLLVRSLSFQLSVAATAGIALLAAPIARRVPGPRWIVEPLAVTLAAQVGVAPVALPAFGGLPVAALPANLLAVPAAAPLTAWGFTAGGIAGVAGHPVDVWLHAPTRVLTWWLAAVARWCARLPLGEVRPVHAVAGLAIAGAWLACRRWRSRSGRTASTSPPVPS